MFTIVYRTTHKETGQYYIGVHTTTDLNDGYLGSGIRIKRMIAKYGPNAFEREVLATFEVENDAYLHEASLVNSERLKDPLCMNIAEGGHAGNWKVHNADPANKKHRVAGALKRNKLPISEETRARISEATRRKWEQGVFKNKNQANFTGKKHTEETKEKIRLTLLSRKNAAKQ